MANVNLLTTTGLPGAAGLILGLAIAALAFALVHRNGLGLSTIVFALGVGFSVALGWVLTFSLAQVAFEPQVVTSATFSGPSANTLMFFLTEDRVLDFDIGLVPGVFLGALIAAWFGRELNFQGFEGEGQMRRPMTGAALMEFSVVLVGGCAIRAGVTGGSIFVATVGWRCSACGWGPG